MTTFVAGIDFGTSNSAAAISDGGTPQMVKLEHDKDTIPTALYFPDKSNDIFFGRDAQHRYTSDNTVGRFMRSMKRILGTDTMRGYTVINGRMVKFDDIIGHFIKYIKQKIDAAAGTPVENVVIGRPVHFRDNDPDGDKRAQDELEKIAYDAGFKNIEFQYEPIAAAFAHEQKLTSDKLACVIDIGGGTSDFTIIRLGPGHKNNTDRTSDVLANTGVRIGGNDFDRALSIKSFMPLFGLGTEYVSAGKRIPVAPAPYISLSTWSSVNDVYNYKTLNLVRGFVVWGCEGDKIRRLYEIIENRTGHKNLAYVEAAKMHLSSEMSIKMCLDFLSDAPNLEISRDTFESAIIADTEKIEHAITDCIMAANVADTDIDLVILTGGSTEIPYINKIAKKRFPCAEISSSDKMCSVGLGLAYDSIRRYTQHCTE